MSAARYVLEVPLSHHSVGKNGTSGGAGNVVVWSASKTITAYTTANPNKASIRVLEFSFGVRRFVTQ